MMIGRPHRRAAIVMLAALGALGGTACGGAGKHPQTEATHTTTAAPGTTPAGMSLLR